MCYCRCQSHWQKVNPDYKGPAVCDSVVATGRNLCNRSGKKQAHRSLNYLPEADEPEW